MMYVNSMTVKNTMLPGSIRIIRKNARRKFSREIVR